MCETNDRVAKPCAGIDGNRNNQYSEPGQFGDCELDLRGVLIVGRALLQARVLVHRVRAAARVTGFGKGHGRRMRGADASMGSTDRLCDQQHAGKQPAGQFSSAPGKGHVITFAVGTHSKPIFHPGSYPVLVLR